MPMPCFEPPGELEDDSCKATLDNEALKCVTRWNWKQMYVTGHWSVDNEKTAELVSLSVPSASP